MEVIMNKEFNFELNNVNKKAIEELLKNKGVRKYAFKLENGEYLELVESQEYDKLKERIDKAVEYIRSNEWAKDYEISNCRTHLLNILQNGSDTSVKNKK